MSEYILVKDGKVVDVVQEKYGEAAINYFRKIQERKDGEIYVKINEKNDSDNEEMK